MRDLWAISIVMGWHYSISMRFYRLKFPLIKSNVSAMRARACMRYSAPTYPDVDLASTSGHERRLLQNANDGRSCGDGWCTGDTRCWRNEPFRGGAKHSNARDCLRIEPWLCGGVIVPGAGTTLGKPAVKTRTKHIQYSITARFSNFLNREKRLEHHFSFIHRVILLLDELWCSRYRTML